MAWYKKGSWVYVTAAERNNLLDAIDVIVNASDGAIDQKRYTRMRHLLRKIFVKAKDAAIESHKQPTNKNKTP